MLDGLAVPNIGTQWPQINQLFRFQRFVQCIKPILSHFSLSRPRTGTTLWNLTASTYAFIIPERQQESKLFFHLFTLIPVFEPMSTSRYMIDVWPRNIMISIHHVLTQFYIQFVEFLLEYQLFSILPSMK